MDGIVVIGEGEKDEAPMLYNGEQRRQRRRRPRSTSRSTPSTDDAHGQGAARRAGGPRGRRARRDVRSGPVRLHGEAGGRRRRRRRASTSRRRSSDNLGRIAGARRKTARRRHGGDPRPPAPPTSSRACWTGARIKFLLDGDVGRRDHGRRRRLVGRHADRHRRDARGRDRRVRHRSASTARSSAALPARRRASATAGARRRLRPRARPHHATIWCRRRRLLRRHRRDRRRAAPRRPLHRPRVLTQSLSMPLESGASASSTAATTRSAPTSSGRGSPRTRSGAPAPGRRAGDRRRRDRRRVAWDAALRGFDVRLVERGDLAEGTSGRFHGLLHSGGRYVVKDADAAEECVAENAILRRVIPDSIEDTGGYFVTTPDDDPAYADRFCGLPGGRLPAEEIEVGEALRGEPRLQPRIRRRLHRVPDASIDAWKTVCSCARGARPRRAHPAPTTPRSTCTASATRSPARACATSAPARSSTSRPASRSTPAARGPRRSCTWPGSRASASSRARDHDRDEPPAGEHGHQPLPRCRRRRHPRPHPHRQRDRDDRHPRRRPRRHHGPQAEVDHMLDDGERLVPAFAGPRAAGAGRRATAVPGRKAGQVHRHARRQPHARRRRPRSATASPACDDVGRKLTTLRLMAEDLVDAMPPRQRAPCNDRRGAAARSRRRVPHRRAPARAGDDRRTSSSICECELIGRQPLEETMRRRETPTSTTSAQPAARHGPVSAASASTARPDPARRRPARTPTRPTTRCAASCRSAGRALWPILYGDQLRQARLDDWIFQGLLDVEHLPSREASCSATWSSSAPAARDWRPRRVSPRAARACASIGQGGRRDAPRARNDRRARLRARRGGGACARAERAGRRAPRPSLRAHGRRERRARAAVVHRAHRRRPTARLPLRRRPRAQPPAAHRGRRAAPVGARARDDGRGRHAPARAGLHRRLPRAA